MIYKCCDEKRKAAVLGNPDAERHRLPRGAGLRRPAAGARAADHPAGALPESGADDAHARATF